MRISPTIATAVQHCWTGQLLNCYCTASPEQCHTPRKRNELEALRETKLSVFRDDIFITNPVGCREKLLEVIGEFGKISRYKENKKH